MKYTSHLKKLNLKKAENRRKEKKTSLKMHLVEDFWLNDFFDPKQLPRVQNIVQERGQERPRRLSGLCGGVLTSAGTSRLESIHGRSLLTPLTHWPGLWRARWRHSAEHCTRRPPHRLFRGHQCKNPGQMWSQPPGAAQDTRANRTTRHYWLAGVLAQGASMHLVHLQYACER